MKSLSCVRLLATPWTVAYQAPPSMESRQEYWSGLPFPSPGDLSTQGLNPGLPHCGQTLHCLSHYVQVIPLTFYLCQNGSNKIHSCVHTIVTNIDITHMHKARRMENKQEPGNRHMVDGARFPSFAFSETVCNLLKSICIIYKYFSHIFLKRSLVFPILLFSSLSLC